MDATSQPPAADPPARPAREPCIWVLKRGGVKVQAEDGSTTIVTLMPREMRKLANVLVYCATQIDKEQPSRIYGSAIDD